MTPLVCTLLPKGQRLKNLRSPSGIEIFNRHWKFQASHPPNPNFCGEFWRSRLNISSAIVFFKRDWTFQARLIFFNLWPLGLSALRISRQNFRDISRANNFVFLGFDAFLPLHVEDPHPTGRNRLTNNLARSIFSWVWGLHVYLAMRIS